MTTDRKVVIKLTSSHRRKQKKCICNKKTLLSQITGTPNPLEATEVNKIRLNLFTERNSDGTGLLKLQGKDIYDRYHFRIQDNDIQAICSYVKSMPRRITAIDLSYNEITDVGFKKMVKKLFVKEKSSVINLNVMNNGLTVKSVAVLAKYAEFLKLKQLRLNGNDLGNECGENLAKFLINNKSLESFDICQSGQTITSVAQIITALRSDHGANTTLKVLNLSRINPPFNRYNYETKWLGYHIEYLLERNTSIIELHLQKNDFIGHDMEYFARGLRNNGSILHLDLGYNRIGDYGAELLARYLSERPQLTVLNLSGNEIKDSGARALSFGLPFSKIRCLDVSNNKIMDRGVLDLLNTLKKPLYLKCLSIWGNKLTQVTCGVIQRMLESGVLIQNAIDVFVYEVDGVLYSAYYRNLVDHFKHEYYCESGYGFAQPIYHIKRNVFLNKFNVK